MKKKLKYFIILLFMIFAFGSIIYISYYSHKYTNKQTSEKKYNEITIFNNELFKELIDKIKANQKENGIILLDRWELDEQQRNEYFEKYKIELLGDIFYEERKEKEFNISNYNDIKDMYKSILSIKNIDYKEEEFINFKQLLNKISGTKNIENILETNNIFLHFTNQGSIPGSDIYFYIENKDNVNINLRKLQMNYFIGIYTNDNIYTHLVETPNKPKELQIPLIHMLIYPKNKKLNFINHEPKTSYEKEKENYKYALNFFNILKDSN
ncbi:hypothetical protein [Mycoplasmopsis felis]|uniref:hypothetical protein n=2 Tax=Mycoplasmopsis felis TaxID=33923 RepID=UPI0021B01546|nr:hypothetical protein [Mycoplasmopsis felis]MCU9934714.1 hypothetical protein [Mycoplasmopsis felis]MCU9939225.1 hypothetical protein [Mycoplasmopsis felis]UWV79380.1 hypothetical protein NW072_04990 [Mycoplasmopsis felis]WAM00603.1 hypothetical protein NWE60_03780 [Mycoplasmopsis felis]WQQ08435.1 hypothetical protein RRG61_03900 [Mycoplasmopsis felis]